MDSPSPRGRDDAAGDAENLASTRPAARHRLHHHSIDEALILSHRIVVMSAARAGEGDPGNTLPTPRHVDVQLSPGYAALKPAYGNSSKAKSVTMTRPRRAMVTARDRNADVQA